jgi:uncharacterized protein
MTKIVSREISNNILKDFNKGKIIVLVGARQVGKTTLLKNIIPNHLKVLFLNADNPFDRANFNIANYEKLLEQIKTFDVIVIDEAQKIEDVGNILKLLIDNVSTSQQIIATGSSSLNLLSRTSEPLTGRKFVHELYGLSLREIDSGDDIDKYLDEIMVFGSYPEVFLSSGEDKTRLLTEITSSYLYKDILELEQVRNPATISKLLSVIALQLGSEVSLSELSSYVGLDVKTVERYIDLLEKNYVLFRLAPYYTNERKSLTKLNKIYFFDLGIRNALINNFNPLSLRNDVGHLWENFLIVERMKFNKLKFQNPPIFFWKTYDGAEVDYIEQIPPNLNGYEFKWSKDKTAPKSWMEYSGATFENITKHNYRDFVGV